MHLTLFAIFRRIKNNLLLNDSGMSNSAKNSKKKFFFLNYKCQMHKLSEFFFKKISWSQMIQNCLIRLEMAKKNRRQTVVFGNSGGTAADLSVFHGGTFNSKDLQKKNGSLSSKMRLIWPKNVNFRRKMSVFGGSGC